MSIIQRETAAYFKVAIEDLRTGDRSTSTARHVARYLERTLGGLSLPEIGRLYSCDHTTALASVRHMTERLAAGDERYVAPVEDITSAVQRIMAKPAPEPLKCPTCGGELVQELLRQITELRSRLDTMEKR